MMESKSQERLNPSQIATMTLGVLAFGAMAVFGFLIGPALLLAGIHLYQLGSLAAFGGVLLIIASIPPLLHILVLQLNSIVKKGNYFGMLFWILYNTAFLWAFKEVVN